LRVLWRWWCACGCSAKASAHAMKAGVYLSVLALSTLAVPLLTPLGKKAAGVWASPTPCTRDGC
jgi:hypothetical protein